MNLPRITFTASIFFIIAGFVGALTWDLNLAQMFEKGTVPYRLLWDLRVPRTLLALGAGGSLAVLGATYQVLFRNPLAEPYLFGVSSAAMLGLVVGEVLLHLPPYSSGSFALGALSALLITGVLVLVSLFRLGPSSEKLVLFGLGLNFFLSALLFLTVSYFNQTLGGGSLRWFFGQMPWLSFGESLLFLGVCIPCTLALSYFSRAIDALSLGASVSRTLGLNPVQLRSLILFFTSIWLAFIVLYTGAIGFVGLVAPHACRLLFQIDRTGQLMLGSFGVGALFLAVSDLVSRWILPPIEFPIGVITTALGGPLLLYLLTRNK